MSVNKFGKYREVNRHYLDIPYKYIMTYTGANEDPTFKNFSEEAFIEQWEKKNPELNEEWCKEEYGTPRWREISHIFNAALMTAKANANKEYKSKDLCIVDFFGKNFALVAWRNNETCKVGMPRLCRIKHTKNGRYLLYKNQEIFIDDNSGWVW